MHSFSRSKVSVMLSLFVVFSTSLAIFLSAQSGSLAAPSHSFLNQTSSQNNWPSFGYDAQGTRSNPNEQVLNATNVSNLALDWTASTTGSIVDNSSPVVVNGIVYIGDASGTLSAFDAASGLLLWMYSNSDAQSPFNDTPMVINGVVYIADSYGTLAALDATTGFLLWTTNLSGGVFSGSPAVVNGEMYVGFSSGGSPYIVALNATTGTLLWKAIVPSSINRPSVANGVVYAASGQIGILSAFDAKTGTVLWQGSLSYGVSGIAIANGIVYINVFTQTPPGFNLYAFNASGCGSTTCSPLWIVPSYGPPTGGLNSPAVASGVVYIGGDGPVSNTATLGAFNSKTGAILWTATVPGNGFNSSAAVANGVVYEATEDGHIYAFNAAGCGNKVCSSLWTYSMGNDYTQSSPTLASGYAFIGATNLASPNNGQLFAFSLPNITPTPSPSPSPSPTLQTIKTNIFAGYASTGSPTNPIIYTDVTATWTVPTVSCSFLTAEYSQSATWAALGDNSIDLEQAGTQSNCVNGVPDYYAVWEVIQGGSQPGKNRIYTLPIFPGNQVKVEVRSLGFGEFTIDIWNLSLVPQGHWSTVVSGDNTSHATALAECIVEDPPDAGGHIVPLSNFTKVTINCTGNNHPIGSAGYIIRKYLMTLFYQKTTTGRLNASGLGKTFSVKWVQA